jgi:hypothetical protein
VEDEKGERKKGNDEHKVVVVMVKNKEHSSSETHDECHVIKQIEVRPKSDMFLYFTVVTSFAFKSPYEIFATTSPCLRRGQGR